MAVKYSRLVSLAQSLEIAGVALSNCSGNIKNIVLRFHIPVNPCKAINTRQNVMKPIHLLPIQVIGELKIHKNDCDN